MEKGKQKIFLLFFLGVFVFLVFANLIVMFNFSNKITAKTSSEASIQFVIQGAYCGDGTCDATEDCSSCVADCACSSGYTCIGGTCVADEEEEDTNGGGGGGGGGAVVPPVKVYDFKLNPFSLRIRMQKGEYYQKQIIVTNNGAGDLLINISLTNLGRFIVLEKESFTLEKGETETIKFNVYASEKEEADVYLGKINFNSQHVSKSVNVVLDIKDRIPLFDMKTTILRRYLLSGEIVEAEVEIINLGDLNNISVELEYSIKNFDNETYVLKKKSFVIDKSFSEKLFLETSKDIKMGEYIFYSKVTYGDKSASSYDSFFIEKLSFLIWIIIITVVVVLIIILVIVAFKQKRKKDNAK
ncbi:hypothetical protein KAT80_02490 [Candidatus Pacearchaeota archaeon]|nr:hypothetical protein [Candidatus Pacearchaeota archaeon]